MKRRRFGSSLVSTVYPRELLHAIGKFLPHRGLPVTVHGLWVGQAHDEPDEHDITPPQNASQKSIRLQCCLPSVR